MHTLITLNIWGGHLEKDLLAFFATHKDTDVFCLQEVYQSAPSKVSTCDMDLSLDIFHDIAQQLPNHQGYFCPVVPHYGLAIFIKKSLAVLHTDQVVIHSNDSYVGKGPTHQRMMQCLSYQGKQHPITICNIHGLWNGKGKLDSPERIAQSTQIKKHTLSIDHPIIVCGDFNLEPQTQSLAIIKEGLEDHIAISHTTSTRTSYYPKPIKFADYVFTSPELTTHQFTALKDEVSDHAPLYLSYDT